MAKRFLSLSLALILAVGLAVQASAAMRAASATPSISFSGSTATCTVIARGDPGDSITITAKVMNRGHCLYTWPMSGTGRVVLTKTIPVSSGQTYTLTADVTIDGEKIPTMSVSKTCP